jgi:hypothetical protein
LVRAHKILDEVASRREQVAARLVGAMREEIPEYGQLLGGPGGGRGSASAGFRREVLTHALAHVDAFVRSGRTGRPPEPAEIDFVRDRAEQRARELLPLEALLQAYLLGQRVWYEAIVEAAGDTAEDLRAVGLLTTTTFPYTYAISALAAESYSRASQEAVSERDRARRDLLDGLLASGADPTVDQVRRARQLGLDPDATYVVVIATASGHPLHLVVEAIARHLSTFTVPRHEEVVGLVATRDAREARSALERAAERAERSHGLALRAGAGTPFTGLGNVARGYAEAHQALRQATAGRPAVALEDLSLLEHLTATADASARNLVPDGVRRLAAEPVLAATLRAYAEADLNVMETARRLDVHPNTVHYRLGRVQQISGRDPRRFGDLLELFAGLRLLGAPGGSAG